MDFKELSIKIAKEVAKDYERRSSLELTGKSLEKKPGKVNFLGSVSDNLNNIMPELMKAIKNNPEILSVEIPEFQNPWSKKK